jgi:hypothetical protein
MPVNYQMDVINPFEAALKGYGAGAQMLQQEQQGARQVQQDQQRNQLFQAQMSEAQARAAKLQQEIENAKLGQASMARLFEAVETNTVTPELVAEVMAVNEKVGTFGAEIFKNQTLETKKASFGNVTRPLAALELGQVDIAKAEFQSQYDAMMNSGNEKGAQVVKSYIDQLGTEEGRNFVRTSLIAMAEGLQPEPGAFKSAWENITATKGEKETEAVQTARTYAASFGAPGSPEYMAAFRTKLLPPPAPGTVVNVGPTGKQLSVGDEAVDKKFADTYVEFVTGGAADAARQIGQLKEALVTLKTNKEITGPLVGIIPENLQSFVVPEAAALRQTVQDVVQRSLKAILGNAFTQKDAEGLMARAFDPALKPEENTKRVERLLTQIDRANSDTQAAVDYFKKNRTLQGYDYKFPTKAEFETAASGKGPATIDFKGMDDRTLTQQDVTKLNREQRASLLAELDRRGL